MFDDSVSFLKIFKFMFYYFFSMFVGFYTSVYPLGNDSTVEEKEKILQNKIGYPESEKQWKEFNQKMKEFRPSFWEKVYFRHGSPISIGELGIISGPICYGLLFPFMGFFIIGIFIIVLCFLLFLTSYLGTNYLGLEEIEGIVNIWESIIVGKPMR